jgi:hypothetical protein
MKKIACKKNGLLVLAEAESDKKKVRIRISVVDPNPKVFAGSESEKKFGYGFGYGSRFRSRHCCRMKLFVRNRRSNTWKSKILCFSIEKYFSDVQVPEHIWKQLEAPFRKLRGQNISQRIRIRIRIRKKKFVDPNEKWVRIHNTDSDITLFLTLTNFCFLTYRYPGSGSAWIRIHFQSWFRIRNHLKSFIRIRIKSMRIRNTFPLR